MTKMITYRDAQIEAQAEFHAHEMNVNGDASWLRWLAAVERLTGIANLDGDNSLQAQTDGTADGYCLDDCSDWFDARWSPARAAAAILKATA